MTSLIAILSPAKTLDMNERSSNLKAATLSSQIMVNFVSAVVDDYCQSTPLRV
jgi:hypothetical protein